ncbi:tetratricopeptide repeat protein [uncultured Thiothrix sp.]|uniref:tetratricopeptide repeat protein n=1 Tax=uncultured Thiothrix sp. TaxID=223185 RepID=UPI002633C36A|nr:tetratricopeptide repeat protein [uncultured Thiothrix sp.]HMT94593.1 tetratricopeptide repeat protein [Thiolinea sp.]
MTKHYSEAEDYYRKALIIFTQLNDRSSEANCLAGLGNVYDASNLTKQAIGFYRESAHVSKNIGDKRHECIVRGNLGNALIKLRCYEDARKELIRAIDCGQYFDSEAELWRVWGNLYMLEKAENNSREAWIAWQEAVKKRVSYRLNGGENNTDAGYLCESFCKTILHEGGHAASRLVAIELADETWGNCIILLNKLAKIALGERSPKLAEDEQLHYEWAAEVLLVLDRLRKAGV